jgi:hypothetical protein
MIIPYVLLVAICTLSFAAHVTMYQEFPYYSKMYGKLKKGHYVYNERASTPNGYFCFNEPTGRRFSNEIIFFSNGSIKLGNGVYIHSFFITYFVPYSLYYLIKFNLLKKRLLLLDFAQENLFVRFPPQHRAVTEQKKIDFKFFR